jgi:uncharacterized RDD family membrane protein YckC
VNVAQIGPVYVPPSEQPAVIVPDIQQLSAAQSRPVFAGFWLRAAAYLLDTVVISLVGGLAASFYPATFIKYPDAAAATASNPFASLPQLTPLGFAITIGATWLYYTLFEASSWQATPGKRVLKIYVTDMFGQRPTFARIAGRNFAKIISNLTFLVGYVVAGFTVKKQALHDLISSCLVLRRR